MNNYQQKWIEVLKAANLKGWEITEQDDDILIMMPNITDLKLVRDNLPEVIAALSLDIDEPKERVKFIFHNNHENFEYTLNPTEKDLNEG
ncbi:hypothetical protein BEL04_11345 [Mucilaginibacter sp. PPCGB 2223]|uniref:hypothetical protein n=1 Tax=Mucilaginibacter sp. PPCGB 2223 TaxID=1886027 RepID=UPI000826FB0D|nr:hypothetical protein [Mucilaginibacter sp. PPCGB 2223]OCX52088.1 hypothetical protein BEL04_11345 [Mucilaginibacter sp. PPCGB 2223]